MTPQQALERAEEIGAEPCCRNQLARQMYQAGPRDAEADMARRRAQAASQVTRGVPHAELEERRAPRGSRRPRPVRRPAPRPLPRPGRQTTGRTSNRKGSSMSDYTGPIAAGGEREVDCLHPATSHPGAFGISTGHPVPPGPGADAAPGPVNHHPGPDFAPREPEAGS
jgi:hypothetical protein